MEKSSSQQHKPDLQKHGQTIKVRVKVKQPSGQETAETPEYQPAQQYVPEYQPVQQYIPAEQPIQQAAPQDAPQEEPVWQSITINTGSKPRMKWPLVLCIVFGFVLALISLLLLWQSHRITKQDINSINGCPELFDITFDMPLETVSEKIKIEHTTKNGSMTADGDPVITKDLDAQFQLYNLPVEHFVCDFDRGYLTNVLFGFSKEKVTYEQLTELYEKIYGASTETSMQHTIWKGAKTTVVIETDLIESLFVVQYKRSLNRNFGVLSFDGDPLDPCGFLTDNYAFDKAPSYFLQDLQQDRDYFIEELGVPEIALFQKYYLLPLFTYMGVEEDLTGISFDMGADKETIEVVSYLFYITAENALDILDGIKDQLDDAYGNLVDCSYTSLYYEDAGIKQCSYETIRTKILAGGQGIYHIGWENERFKISIGLTIQDGEIYYAGDVSFSLQPPHEHAYVEHDGAEPTCIADGIKNFVCDCGDSYIEVVPATGHSFSGPTCVEPAICAFCGAASATIGSHTYTAKVIAPTCTAKGYTTYTCFCGDSYEGDQTAALPHTFENYKCTVCAAVDKSNATKYLEYWLKENGEYDSSVPCYNYTDLYESNVLCYTLGFTVSGNTIFVERENIEQGIYGYTALVFSNGAYITQFGNACIEGTISKAAFDGNSPISHSSYIGNEEALSLMSDLAKASIADTLDWLAWFLAAHNVGITLADLGFVSYL